jgi:hypothetical protein
MDIKGNFDDIIRKFEERQKKMRDGLRTATEKATAYAHSQVPKYPTPPAPGEWARKTSPAQKRAFFVQLRAGGWKKRTGTLGRSIATDVRELGSSFVGVIGTGVVYAPYVISDKAVEQRGPQALMHAGRWWTLQGVVRGAKDEIMKIYKRVIGEVTQ